LTSLDNIEKYWSWAAIENTQQTTSKIQQHSQSEIKKECTNDEEIVNAFHPNVQVFIHSLQ
jgi:hypothetical protein